MNRQIRHNIQEIKLPTYYELMLYPVSISDTERLCVRYSINNALQIERVMEELFNLLADANTDTYNVVCFNHGYYTAVYIISESLLEDLMISYDTLISENQNQESPRLKEQEVVNEES